MNFAENTRHSFIQDWSKDISHKMTIADIGAGQGNYKKYFSHCKYYSTDFGKYFGTIEGPLKEHWDYGTINIISDVTDLPLKSNTFDRILCTEVLEHVFQPISVVKELYRVTKKGGKILITAPLGSGIHQEPHHYYGGFSPYFYEKIFSDLHPQKILIKPIGGFFAHLAQEVIRAGLLLESKGKYHLIHHILGFLFRIFGQWIYSLDKKWSIREFAVGFIIEVVK